MQNPATLMVNPVHSDDLAVDRFAAAMKLKLAYAREQKGRSGWDTDLCNGSFLSRLLHDSVTKKDPVDVANFAMMLHQRGEKIEITDEKGQRNTDTDVIHWYSCSECRPVENKYILVKGMMDGPHDWRTRLGWYDDQCESWHVDGASWVPLKWAYLPEAKENIEHRDGQVAN